MTTITISGAGDCIHNEIYVITAALLKFGWEVTITNDRPRDPDSDDHILSQNKELKGNPYHRTTIIAEHLPWGG